MEREEIIGMIRSTLATVPEETTHELMDGFWQARTELLIDTLRNVTSILACRIVGAENFLHDTQESRDQWIAAMKEICEAHIESITSPRNMEDYET